MLLVTHKETGKKCYGIEDPKAAYSVSVKKIVYTFEDGLEVKFSYDKFIPTKGGWIVASSYSFDVDLVKSQFDKIKSKIMAHKVISYNIIKNIIDDVKAGK